MSHTAEMGGGERSLLALIAARPPGLSLSAAAPEGQLSVELRRLGVSTTSISGTHASLSRSPIAAASGLSELLASTRALRRHTREVQPDVVHANSLRAGVMCAGAGLRPLVVSIRDVLPRGFRATLAQRFVASRADAVVANSRFTADRFAAATGREPVIVHPPIAVDHAGATPDEARLRLRLPPEAQILAVIGQLTRWKGQLEAIEVFDLVRQENPSVRLLIVGESKFIGGRYDNRAYEAALRRAVIDRGLEDNVSFLGERQDVDQILPAVDVLLAPSWEEPFGRVVVEAMAAGRAVVATDRGGPAEIIEHGRTGFLIGPRQPVAWAGTVSDLLAAPSLRSAVGEAAIVSARRFTVPEHVKNVVEIYSRVTQSVQPRQRALEGER